MKNQVKHFNSLPTILSYQLKPLLKFIKQDGRLSCSLNGLNRIYPWCIWSDFWKIKMVLPPKNVMSFRLSVAHGGISSILRQISTNGRYLHSLRSVDMTVFFFIRPKCTTGRI